MDETFEIIKAGAPDDPQNGPLPYPADVLKRGGGLSVSHVQNCSARSAIIPARKVFVETTW